MGIKKDQLNDTEPVFPSDYLGKVDVDWTNIPAAGSQQQDTGLDIVLPAGTYSLVLVSARMIGAESGLAPTFSELIGSIAFDDQADTPDNRLVVAQGSFDIGDPGNIGFQAIDVAADGSLLLTLSNSGGATNFSRLAIMVSTPVAIPFSVPSP